MVKIQLKNILLIVSFLLMDIFYVYGDGRKGQPLLSIHQVFEKHLRRFQND